jgi:hypothetical protein
MYYFICNWIGIVCVLWVSADSLLGPFAGNRVHSLSAESVDNNYINYYILTT